MSLGLLDTIQIYQAALDLFGHFPFSISHLVIGLVRRTLVCRRVEPGAWESSETWIPTVDKLKSSSDKSPATIMSLGLLDTTQIYQAALDLYWSFSIFHFSSGHWTCPTNFSLSCGRIQVSDYRQVPGPTRRQPKIRRTSHRRRS